MGWTKEQYLEFCKRSGVSASEGLRLGVISLEKKNHANKARTRLRPTKPERVPVLALGAEGAREEAGGPRAHRRVGVRIEIRRVKLCDEDNSYGSVKPLVDCLRLAGLVKDDSTEAIALTVTQEKVAGKKEQGVTVTLTYPGHPCPNLKSSPPGYLSL